MVILSLALDGQGDPSDTVEDAKVIIEEIQNGITETVTVIHNPPKVVETLT